jgi:DNA-binding CsgD family transcriptional regulator
MTAARTPDAPARAGLALARALTPLGRFDEALEAFAAAERESVELDDSSRLALQVETMMLTSWYRGTEPLFGPLAALRVDEMSGATPVERLLLALRAMEAASTGADRPKVIRIARRVLAAADVRDPADEYASLTASRCLGLADAVGEARAALGALVAESRVRGAVSTLVHATGMRAEVGFRAGLLHEAEADASESYAIAAEHGLGLAVAVTLPILVDVMLEREPAARAASLLEPLGDFEAVPPGYARQMLFFARGSVALALRDARAAVALFQDCGRAQAEWGEHNPTARPWRSRLALALAELGRTEEAVELAGEELRLARRFGAERAIGIALRACALLRHGPERITGLRDAARVLAGSPALLEHARTNFHFGAALRHGRSTREARDVLAEALDEADRCGAHVLAEQIRSELRITGARPRRDRIRGPDSLTASERRVAELAARGLKNKQIAQELFLTTKTVETHLGHVYPKLGIAGRDGLEFALRSVEPAH